LIQILLSVKISTTLCGIERFRTKGLVRFYAQIASETEKILADNLFFIRILNNFPEHV